MKPLTSSVTRLGEISALLQNFDYLWKSFGGSFSDKRNFLPNLGNIWANVNCFKWPNVEQIIWSYC